MPQRPTMRVLGTTLPSSQTVHENVLGPRPVGRPIVIGPRNLKLSKDKSRPGGHRLLWQNINPGVLERADDLMGTYMPPGLMPDALRYVNARKHRREH